MHISVRYLTPTLAEVIVREGGMDLNLGLLDDEQRKELALVLREAAHELWSDR